MSAAERAPAPQSRPVAVHGPGRPDKYVDAAGKQVPSVTTITGRFKDSGALIAWAHKQGAQGIPLTEARDKGADAGHVVHAWIADELAGRTRTEFPFTSDEIIEKAIRALVAFEDWSLRVDLRMLATEFPLVHSQYGYGGTFDGIGEVTTALGARELVLLDWKTGNRTYPEHLIQLAAYRELLRDAAPDKGLPMPEAGLLIRLDKDEGTPHPREFPREALDLGWEYFTGALDLYELDKSLSKMVAEPAKRRGGGKAAAGGAA